MGWHGQRNASGGRQVPDAELGQGEWGRGARRYNITRRAMRRRLHRRRKRLCPSEVQRYGFGSFRKSDSTTHFTFRVRCRVASSASRCVAQSPATRGVGKRWAEARESQRCWRTPPEGPGTLRVAPAGITMDGRALRWGCLSATSLPSRTPARRPPNLRNPYVSSRRMP